MEGRISKLKGIKMKEKPASKTPDYSKMQTRHCKIGEVPQRDDGYFEKMVMMIFRAGLNWGVIENKWLNFTEAFEQFSVDAVADFDVPEIDRLMEDRGIVRNYKKIAGTVKMRRNSLLFARSTARLPNFSVPSVKMVKKNSANRSANGLRTWVNRLR